MDRLNETTYNKEVKSNPSDRIVVEVGDVLQPDFKPQVKIKRWDNEVNFSMRAEEHPEATVEEVDGVIKYITPKYEVHQYEKPEAGEDGGFEFEWVLKEMPESNVLTTTIQSKGLNFFYQPALTQEEIDSGSSRPENVIGSYAVYHSEKRDNKVGGMEYKTGKVFHIYRPEAVDANGVRAWCELNIENGTLTVTVPQEFLNTAMYPVIVDPTFGYTSAGASTNGNTVNDFLFWTRFTSPGDGTISKLTIYTEYENNTIAGRAMVYLSSDNSLLASAASQTISNATASWIDFDLTLAITNGTDYLLSGFSDAPGSSRYALFYYDVSGVTNAVDEAYSPGQYPTIPDPAPASISRQRNYSIYATYTEPSSFTPSPMMHMMAQSGGLV